jgi:imidazoleglycerol phosphate dehydratase HisB
MCIDYQKLNKTTKKDHFPLPFIDEMLEQLAKHSFFCFIDGYLGYHQIPIHPDDQSKTNLCLSQDVFRIMQHSSFVPRVHDVYIF